MCGWQSDAVAYLLNSIYDPYGFRRLYGHFLLALISLNFNLAKLLIQFLPKGITQELSLLRSMLCGIDTAILPNQYTDANLQQIYTNRRRAIQ